MGERMQAVPVACGKLFGDVVRNRGQGRCNVLSPSHQLSYSYKDQYISDALIRGRREVQQENE